jgi:phage-related protein
VALLNGFVREIPQLIGQVPNIIKGIISGFAAGWGSMKEVGGDMVKGIWNGINDMTGWILDKIKGFGKKVLDGIKSFFGIKSPSRLFKDEVGANLAFGVGEGFTENMSKVTAQMQDALPTSFDTGVNINANTASALRAAALKTRTPGQQFDFNTLVAAVKQGMTGVNVILDDKKVGNFVTETVERQVFA